MQDTQKTPHYMTQFPDYDNGPAFDAIAKEIAPFGFKDGSWKNDENPCLILALENERELKVYVEYKAEETREFSPASITFHNWETGEDTYHDVRTFDPKDIRKALIEELAKIPPVLPEISTENTLDQLCDALDRFAAGTALEPRSADEMLYEIPEDHPHKDAAWTWLRSFSEIWTDVEDAVTQEERSYQEWRITANERPATEEDREIYPEAGRVIEFSDGGRIGKDWNLGDGYTYQVFAGRFDGTFEDIEEARRALWREHSRFETGAAT